MADRQPSIRRATFFLWLERLLLLAGAAALVWVGFVVADAAVAQRRARSALEAAVPVAEPVVAPGLEELTVPDEPAAAMGSAIADLAVPRIQLAAAVLQGTDARTLRRGPGHLENTAYPGEVGNIVIAGHRDSFFWPLRHIRVNDDIVLDTPRGRFHYQVTSLRVVDPRNLSVIAPTTDAVLTLVTCYPFWVLGHAPARFIVRAQLRESPAVPLLGSRRLPLAELTGAPTIAVRAPTEVLARAVAIAHDDRTLVKQAVERYRRAYNARSTGTYDEHHARPIAPWECDVLISEREATARCDDRNQAQDRTFTLERVDGAWAIRSIVLR